MDMVSFVRRKCWKESALEQNFTPPSEVQLQIPSKREMLVSEVAVKR